MSRLSDIPVSVVSDTPDSADSGDNGSTVEMALPVLHELQAMLERLIETGEPSSIDLRRTPLSPEDHETLDRVLGRGEVSATVNALGPTHIQETAVAGIWRVTHGNQDGKTLGEIVEVTTCPELLGTPAQELPSGLTRLRARLAQRTHVPDPNDVVRSMRALGLSESAIRQNPKLSPLTNGGNRNAE